MSTTITIGGSDYTLPSQSASPPWGEDLSDLISALATVVSSISGPADINTTSVTITNNVAVATNVVGCSFDTSVVRSAIIFYSIYRSSSTTEMSEAGHIYLAYSTISASWEMAQVGVGSSGVTFSISAAGQVKYVSTNFGGTSYVGKMKFKATSFLQT